MESKILLPVSPEMAEKLFNGRKRCIYSNKSPKKKVDKVLIYVPEPVNKVCGEALIKDIQSGKPEDIWKETKNSSLVGLKLYKKIYSNYDKLVAYKIKKITVYNEPKSLEFYSLKNTPKTLRYVQETLSNDKIEGRNTSKKIETTSKKQNIVPKKPVENPKKVTVKKSSIKDETWYNNVVNNENGVNVISPDILAKELSISVNDAHELMDKFEKELKPVLRIKCPFCGTEDIDFYNTYNALPIFMNCSKCHKEIPHIMRNANILYIERN